MDEVQKYRKLFNFKINYEKSVILPSHVSSAVAISLQHTYPFVWKADSLYYLFIGKDNDRPAVMEKLLSNMVW